MTRLSRNAPPRWRSSPDRRRRRAQQLRLGRGRVVGVAADVGHDGGDVGGRVPGDDGVDRARRPGHAGVALQRGVARGESQQRGEVPAGRLAPRRDPARVDAQVAGAGTQPADRGLGVVQLGRPGGLPGEPVVDARDRDPGLRHLLERARVGVAERRAGAVPAAQPPRAAVQEHHHRHRIGPGRRQHEVELQRADARDRRVRDAEQQPGAAGAGTGHRQRQVVGGQGERGHRDQASGQRWSGMNRMPCCCAAACIRGKSGTNGGCSVVAWSVSVPMCWKNRSNPPESTPIIRAASSTR